MNVHELVAQAAQQWPERTAIRDDRGSMTFAELDAAVQALTAQLVAAGLAPRQGLGVMARNGRDFIVAVFAGLGAGCTVMPISPLMKPAEVQAELTRAPLHAILDDRSGVAPLDAGAPAVGDFRLAWTGVDTAKPLVPHVPDAAFVRFTSGTTGTSKGVVVGHASVLARTAAAQRSLGLGPDDTVVWVLPMAYHFIVSIVMYVRYGVCIAVCRDMLARTILDTTAEARGTLLYAAPTHYKMLAADASGALLPTLRRAISTSAGIPRDVAEAFAARFHLPITQAYGIIEVGLPAGNLDACDEAPDAIGRAFPDYEVAILDDAGVPVPPGTVGHLAMRGPGMFDAYLSPPQPREEVLQHGWFMTGDLASASADGIIRVAGRRKSMINVAGLKVFPEEVEATLNQHPQVRRSRVFGVAHALMGEMVVAELEPRGDTVDVDAVRRFARERLSTHKVPQRLEVVSSIAMTPTGKVARAP